MPSALTALTALTTCCTYCGIHEVSDVSTIRIRILACQPQARLDSKEKVLWCFSFFSPKRGNQKCPEMPELQILPFFLPCLEEEEEKAAAERGEGQHFAIDSCRVFCGNGLAEI